MDSELARAFSKDGFALPKDYSWDVTVVQGMKEGITTVKDEDDCIVCRLKYKHDALNGVCSFYDSGILKERITFVNNVPDGWGCKIVGVKEKEEYIYKNGVKKMKLKRYDKLKEYWMTTDCDDPTSVVICQYDDDFTPIANGYIFSGERIQRVVLYENGEITAILKTFKDSKMTEFDGNGNKVYNGDYLDDIASDYPRDGYGKEYENHTLIYKGEWENGRRNGDGIAYSNSLAVYKGEWQNGQRCGKGVLYIKGEPQYEGEWRDDQLIAKIGDDGQNETISSSSNNNSQGEIANQPSFDSERLESILNSKILLNVPSYNLSNINNPHISKATIIQRVNSGRDLQLILSDKSMKNSIKQLLICEGCGNELMIDLFLSGFANLEYILFEKKTLMNLRSLTISNNPRLEQIVLNDNADQTKPGTGVGENVETVVFESKICI